MDDLKLFAKSKNQIDYLVQTVQIFSEDIAMHIWNKEVWSTLHGDTKSY